MRAKYYKIRGIVQGVGFRPFVYNLACANNLQGYVRNGTDGVELELQGSVQGIENFEKMLKESPPPLARIDRLESSYVPIRQRDGFKILQSDAQSVKTTLVSPDIAVCEACLSDLKTGRYKGYFAVNCTNCGPRYSIIKTLPYDRQQTSMADFEMCDTCKREYEDPYNRRYHAQPIACEVCGPRLDGSVEDIAFAIKSGKIIAMKGIGGFHLLCDARNDAVLEELRKYKNRSTKPFAVMCRDILQVKSLAEVSKKEEELLCSKEAPIVLLSKKSKCAVSELTAPNIDRLGCMLPYTPLQHLLFEHLEGPIVATSANLGDEPIITTKEELESKLPFVEYILDFNRDIVNAVDDSVVQVAAGTTQVLRLARGYAPRVIKLPFSVSQKVLAVGGNQKSTVALAFEDTVILSPHIGDLSSLKAFEYFERTIETFKRFYDFQPDVIVHDKHPNYETTKWAKVQGTETVEYGHHLTHIYACMAEYGLNGEYLGFSFDGTGYGDNGTLWGGEVFVGNNRKYYFKPVRLLGGEKAVKEPRRVALAMLFEKMSLKEILASGFASVKSFKRSEIVLLHQSWLKRLNTPLSSSVGRLFDAVASFANLCQYQSYEGEAGLLCEAHHDTEITEYFEYTIENGVIDIKFDFHDAEIVSKFMNTLKAIIVDIAKKEAKEVILSGGVFQNRTLLEAALDGLKEEKIGYYVQEQTPVNDGGIALGQVYQYLLKFYMNKY